MLTHLSRLLCFVCLAMFVMFGTGGRVMSDDAGALVSVSYEPAQNTVHITLPEPLAAALVPERLPNWITPLECEGVCTSYVGQLPDIEAQNPTIGADTSAAYMIGALGWIPDVTEGASARIELSSRAPFRGVAAGDLLSEVAGRSSYSALFALDGSWGEADIFFGAYEVEERLLELQGQSVRVRTYFTTKDADVAPAYLDAASRYIARYSDEIGPYPNAGFAIVSAPIPVGYAFDGLTYVSEQILSHPYMLGRSLAHEVVHNWWGSGVQIAYAQGNWAEGLTTYLADYAMAEDEGAQAAKAMRRDWLAALSSLEPAQDMPLRAFLSYGHSGDQSVGYGKSAMLFHMLRTRLGEETFAAGLTAFWQANDGRRATWGDVQDAFEKVSGDDLSPYFTQWLDRSGVPMISLEAARVTRTGTGYSVAVDLRQSGAPFDVALPVVIRSEAGALHGVAQMETAEATFTFETKARPTSLAIDPDFDALRHLDAGELPVTLRDVIRAGQVALVSSEQGIGAAAELAKQFFRTPSDHPRQPPSADLAPRTGVIAIGATDEVALLRAAHFEAPAPAIASEGDLRVWTEADRAGRHWLFVTGDGLADMPDRLKILRYYSGESFVSFGGEGRPVSGRWAVTDSPLEARFE